MDITRSETDAKHASKNGRHRGRVLLAALLVAGITTGPAHAEFVSSELLYDLLSEAMRQGGSFKDSTLSMGYVTGVHDLLPEGEVCLPPETSSKTLQAAVYRWMKANESHWDPVGAPTVRRALMATYPCDKARAR